MLDFHTASSIFGWLAPALGSTSSLRKTINRLKYALVSAYYDQMRLALPKMVKDKSITKICTIYQDDEFGLEVLRGAEAGLIHKLGGKAMDAMYATMSVQNPYLDEASQPIRFWANKYKTRLNEDPTVFSVYSYTVIDLFIQAAQKAGPNLTTDSFIKAMDTMVISPDMFGSAPSSYSATKRIGSNASSLSQIQEGKWKVISPYFGDDVVPAKK